ncbi:MAG: hypothetical protein NVSMB52_09370 [Chloroflexota bacterium]
MTGDLDLLWDGATERAPALAAAFNSVSAIVTDDGIPIPCDTQAFHLPKVLYRCCFAGGDCCTPALPWRTLPITSFLARAREATTHDGLTIRYMDRQDLIDMRRAVGRIKDLRRAYELERLSGDQ